MNNTEQQEIRIMPCLDTQNGRVVKGVRFVDLVDAGDPVECCRAYCQAGADELALLDICATVEGRPTMLDLVRRTAEVISVPFTVGGGIADLKGAQEVLKAGADKISISSAAFRTPSLIEELIKEFGPERITVAIDAGANPGMPSGYEVFVEGGRTATGRDVRSWAQEVCSYGVTSLLPTSKNTDGVRSGYDIPLISVLRAACEASIIASGGAGRMEHFLEAARAGAQVLLAASVFHFNSISIPDLKSYLSRNGIRVRNCPGN